MKYKSIFSFLFLYSSLSVCSQTSSPLNIQWQKYFGGTGSETAKSVVPPTKDIKPLLSEKLIIKK
jgi:hypothetical protein